MTLILSLSLIVTVFQSLLVSFSNPGFFKPEQRELDKDSSISNVCLFNRLYFLEMLVATIGERNIMLKYCKTCKIIKDLRVFHCKYCDLCVMRHGKY